MAKKRAFPSSLKGKSTPAKSRRGQSSSRPAVIPWSAKDPENLDDDIYWEDPSMAKDENAIKEFKDYVFRCVPLKFPFEVDAYWESFLDFLPNNEYSFPF